MTNQPFEEACHRFVQWLEGQVESAAIGRNIDSSPVRPDGLFFLGRLAPVDSVVALGMGERGERIDPCAAGVSVVPASPPPWGFTAAVSCSVWLRARGEEWHKVYVPAVEIPINIAGAEPADFTFGAAELSTAIANATQIAAFSAEVRVEVDRAEGELALNVELVNTTPDDTELLADRNLYETTLTLQGIPHRPFFLTEAADAFRYDRSVDCYGINGGAVISPGDNSVSIRNAPSVSEFRPTYWVGPAPEPDLSFRRLATDPLPVLSELVEAHRVWGDSNWSDESLDRRAQAEGWTSDMRGAAGDAAAEFHVEAERLAIGLSLLRDVPELGRAFSLMNEAIAHSAERRGFSSWRPFQIGYLLANLASLSDPVTESATVDIVWFATGGGKTETYLGLLITAAFLDRLKGKSAGITAWSRFPLRMLSLQQTQRFADAMAGAEIVRRRHAIPGEAFSVGFFVGSGATPNRVLEHPEEGDFDPDDDEQVAAMRVLLNCPFCESEVEMGFSHLRWTLEHRCPNPECAWPDDGLPFFIVDEEIYRFLPTIVVGTLDKAASIAWQASMRGFVGSPHARCTEAGHGYCYAKRSGRPNGCLVPGCRGGRGPLDMERELFPPSFRLQDELHLLRDSLGSVDSHYESLFDSLQEQLAGRRPKILASSATLRGYGEQAAALYRRGARAFPVPSPSPTSGFWTTATAQRSRHYVAIAPRGVTTDFAVDRIVTTLQMAIRRLVDDQEGVCAEAGVDVEHATGLMSNYGVTVVYGNTLRDLEAVSRSIQTQIPFTVETAELTGATDFQEVRATLDRLSEPEASFNERIHVVTASSMMSHGVDIDRLNVMVMIGVPLTASEFIQATARVGRALPGLVFVLHKIARERDAAVYRSFSQFVSHGERFVEPVAITRRSRRVLERTMPGIETARILSIHEPSSADTLTQSARIRDFFERTGVDADSEGAAVVEALGFTEDMDDLLRSTSQDWMELFFRNLNDPSLGSESLFKLTPWAENGPMRSLRDVEEQTTVRD